jgi:transcriptional regulator with XRE-family HTH domain
MAWIPLRIGEMVGWQKVDGGRLRELRKSLGLSQAALAEKARTTQVTISLLERGERTAQPRTVRKLADALGVEPRELVAQRAGRLKQV